MTKKLIKHMFSEYEDFMEYIEMYDDCKDPTFKAEIKKIAEEEMNHYKRIYDMLFSKTAMPENAKWTDIEKGVYEYATHLYDDMADQLAKVK